MQGVGLREQDHVSGREFAGKAGPRGTVTLGEAYTVEKAAHQSSRLLARIPRGALQIPQHDPFVGAPQPAIGKPLEHARDECVALRVVSTGLELDFMGAIKKGA